MSYAVRSDQTGLRAVDGPDDILPGEYWSESAPELRPAASSIDVDAERDRRVADGYYFDGKLYQTESQDDRENILGAAYTSMAAIMAGAQKGDLRWNPAYPDSDFFWIAADNSRTSMDAQTTQEFARGAMAYKSRLVVAGSNLKAMEPIPEDYADDKWWP